jgi:hypothetical protein
MLVGSKHILHVGKNGTQPIVTHVYLNTVHIHRCAGPLPSSELSHAFYLGSAVVLCYMVIYCMVLAVGGVSGTPCLTATA